MLKVEIWPSFLNRSSFELKYLEAGWELFLAKDSFEEHNDTGQIWHAAEIVPELPTKIIALAQSVIEQPSPPNHGLDGVSVELRLNQGDGEQRGKFWSPSLQTPECEFMAMLFDLARENISDLKCGSYLDQLGTYFFED